MSLFTLDNILLEEDQSSIINLDDIGYIDSDVSNYSFVKEGYSFILEMNRQFINADKCFYKTIMESYGDDNIINESFSDFFQKIKDIIKKFIDWIKKVFKEFSIKLASLFNSDKYLKNKKNKELLMKFDYNDEFEFNGYEFTNLGAGSLVPVSNALDAFTSSDGNKDNYFSNYNTAYEKFYSNDAWLDSVTNTGKNNELTGDQIEANRKKATEELNKTLKSYYDNLSDGMEDFYDEFRGRVINDASRKIDASDFANELFELFRDGYDSPSSITITHDYVIEAYNRFLNYKDVIKEVEKKQKEIIKDYEALQKYLDKMISMNTTAAKYGSVDNQKDFNDISLDIRTTSNAYVTRNIGDLGDTSAVKMYNKTTFDTMNSYLRLQATKVTNMCQIHTQAFSARLEAEKSQYLQDKKILYHALSKVEKHINKK